MKEHEDGAGERSVDNHEAALAEEQNPIGKRHEILKKDKIFNLTKIPLGCLYTHSVAGTHNGDGLCV